MPPIKGKPRRPQLWDPENRGNVTLRRSLLPALCPDSEEWLRTVELCPDEQAGQDSIKEVERAPKTPRKTSAPPVEPSHRQRFEQLLDDAVLDMPPKR